MIPAPCLVPGLMRRYEPPGARYYPYPPADQFCPAFDEAQLRDAASLSNGDPIPRRISLCVHVPLCVRPYFYSGCDPFTNPESPPAELYLAHLYREIELAASLIDSDRKVIRAHFGGGTLALLALTQITQVLTTLRENFHFADSPDCELSIEFDPGLLLPGEVAGLAGIGFNCATLVPRGFDLPMQEAPNPPSRGERIAAIVHACRDIGFRSVRVDLDYGRPERDDEGFAGTLDAVIAMRPGQIVVCSYAQFPELQSTRKGLEVVDLPTQEFLLGLLQLAIQRLTKAGYLYIGMDHFALPDDDLARAQAHAALHRNFMGYTPHAESDLIGLGVGAISHVGDCYSQNLQDIPSWQAAVDADRLPVFRGLQLGKDDQLRADLIEQLLCQGEISIDALERRYGIEFDRYFWLALEQLRPLVDDGMVRREPKCISVTAQGRLLLRTIAQCFDKNNNHRTSVPDPHLSR